MILTRLFCDVDDFYQTFIPQWEKMLIETGERKRKKQRCISCSEIITLIVYYHQSGYETLCGFISAICLSI
jgi:hypothetical protein